MRKIYQLRTTKGITGRKIQYRNITCACSNCVISNYAACLTNSTWKTVDLEKRVQEAQRSRNNHRQKEPTVSKSSSEDDSNSSSSENEQQKDNMREHVNGAIGRTLIPIYESFRTRNERQAAISSARTNRIEARVKSRLICD